MLETNQAIVSKYNILDVPSLAVIFKKKHVIFDGTSKEVLPFVYKLRSKPFKVLKSIQDVEEFLRPTAVDNETDQVDFRPKSSTSVVGIFAGKDSDEYEEYVQAAKEMQHSRHIFFGIVTDYDAAMKLQAKHHKWYKRPPAVLLRQHMNKEDIMLEEVVSNVVNDKVDFDNVRSLNLEEFYGKLSLAGWIGQKSLQLVAKLTSDNFRNYEMVALPMCILFLDLDAHPLWSKFTQVERIVYCPIR